MSKKTDNKRSKYKVDAKVSSKQSSKPCCGKYKKYLAWTVAVVGALAIFYFLNGYFEWNVIESLQNGSEGTSDSTS